LSSVFACWRLRGLFGTWNVGALVRFHDSQADSDGALASGVRQLGRLTAGARALPRKELVQRYAEGFMSALAADRHAAAADDAMQHMVGYFKNLLDGASKAELLARSRTTGASSCRSSCRSHCSGMSAFTTSSAGGTAASSRIRKLMLRNHV
jgi:uncharacterized protein YbgA (DUF1722 family)